LGQALQASAPNHLAGQPLELIPLTRDELDLSDANACREAVHIFRPHWVLNAGAYTAVDRAEKERALAGAVNAGAPRAFAEALLDSGGYLLQLSTDFVFNGLQGRPYATDNQRDPLGVYGASKAEGEQAVEELLLPVGRGKILRTSWVIGPVGNNFVLTMLRLHAEHETLNVVADQVGCPTSTHTLAEACWGAIDYQQQGLNLPDVIHWSDAGVASWYDLAVAVGELGQELGLLNSTAQIKPIDTASYPTLAKRPAYSLLDCIETRRLLKLQSLHWRRALAQVLVKVKRIRSAPSKLS